MLQLVNMKESFNGTEKDKEAERPATRKGKAALFAAVFVALSPTNSHAATNPESQDAMGDVYETPEVSLTHELEIKGKFQLLEEKLDKLQVRVQEPQFKPLTNLTDRQREGVNGAKRNFELIFTYLNEVPNFTKGEKERELDSMNGAVYYFEQISQRYEEDILLQALYELKETLK